VNGQRLTKAARRRIGFVLQDDVLYETLTVIVGVSLAVRCRLAVMCHM
jgi:ABC-type multidrug transport system ATPase subunit